MGKFPLSVVSDAKHSLSLYASKRELSHSFHFVSFTPRVLFKAFGWVG
jgi:hypothetical protein